MVRRSTVLVLRRLIAHRAAKNAFWLTVVQVVSYATQLSVIPYLTRQLGVAEFGATMSAVAAMALAFVITDYGFSLSSTYEISRCRDSRSQVQSIISEVHGAKIPLIVVAGLGVTILSFIPSFRPYQLIFFASLPSILGRAYQPIWFFQGMEDMRSFAVYVALAKITYAIAVFAIVREPGDGYLVLLSLGSADLVAAALGNAMIWRLGYSPFRVSVGGVASGLCKSFDYFISRLAVAIYTSASSLVVGAVNLHQAALYASAEQVYKAGQSVTAPINQALFPFMAKERCPKLLLRIVPPVAFVLALGALLVGVLAQPISIFVFGTQYTDMAPVMRIFLATIVVNYVGVSLGYPLFAALNSPDIANKTVMVGAGLHVIVLLVLYLLNSLSAVAVVGAVLCTETVVMCLRLVLGISVRRAIAP